MGIASVQALLCSMMALSAAAIHGFTYAVRRKEPAHLWLAVSALGILAIAVSTALMYEVSTAAEGEFWQRVMLGAAAPTLIGFHYFSLSLLELERSRIDRYFVLGAGALVLQLFWPGLVFGGAEIERNVAYLDLHYYARDMGAFGAAVVAIFGAYIAFIARIWFTHRSKITEGRNLLIAAFSLLLLSGINDLAIGLRLYDAPMAIVFGYTGFLVALSSILLRRLIRSMDEVERHAEVLHELVAQRTEELRQKDLQLAHGDRMATIGTLAASVAHEINNPIAFVSSNLNHLENITKEIELDEVAEVILECREGVDRVRGIVADLLSMARRSDGFEEPVNLPEVVRSALGMLANAARYRTRLETQLAPVPAVMGDARLLGQVVVNLVLNAIQAIPEGNSESNRVVVSTSNQNGSVRLAVRDTGPGIPDELVERIFDPFFTTKAKDEGTGLGLAVTHQLVTRYRGSIAVDTDSSGTTIVVELPSAPDPPGAAATETQPPD
jgi:signal transduction histidine kinase